MAGPFSPTAAMIGVAVKAAVGGICAVVLLAIYVYVVATGILVARWVAIPNCTAHPREAFTPEIASTMALIGGLVSALVVSELAITPPGKQPLARAIRANASGRRRKAVTISTWAYIAVWFVVGLWAFVTGVLSILGFSSHLLI